MAQACCFSNHMRERITRIWLDIGCLVVSNLTKNMHKPMTPGPLFNSRFDKTLFLTTGQNYSSKIVKAINNHNSRDHETCKHKWQVISLEDWTLNKYMKPIPPLSENKQLKRTNLHWPHGSSMMMKSYHLIQVADTIRSSDIWFCF